MYKSLPCLLLCRCALKFITWTSTDVPSCDSGASQLDFSDELCVLPPDISIKIATELGFDAVKYEEISAAEAEKHMLEVGKYTCRNTYLNLSHPTTCN